MKNRNQLLVLLAVAAWVIFYCYRFRAAYPPALRADGGIDLYIFTGYILAHSLPALAFGAVLFWWFGKNKG